MRQYLVIAKVEKMLGLKKMKILISNTFYLENIENSIKLFIAQAFLSGRFGHYGNCRWSFVFKPMGAMDFRF